MKEELLGFLVFLFILAVVLRENFIFTVLYLFTGAYILGGIWSKRAIASISYKRTYSDRVFLNEEIKVKVQITNTSLFPVVWLRVQDSLPVDLSVEKSFKQVLSIGPYGKHNYEYNLLARKRGFYPIGPLFAYSGDLLGLMGEQHKEGAADYLTVYPKIIPLSSLTLPSRSPMGTLRHKQPIFEDPTRILSKRDYVAGDSLRRVDWKASAAIGRLQVKQFEPSIALETAIFLNLNAPDYDIKNRIDATELGITIAASIATRVIAQKQTVGMYTNGIDPMSINGKLLTNEEAIAAIFKPLPPRKGQGHLMRILDILARIQVAETFSLVELLRKEYINLSWGTTIILITDHADENLFDILFQVRRAGLNIVIILISHVVHSREVQQKAEYFGFPLYHIYSERDLDIWRK